MMKAISLWNCRTWTMSRRDYLTQKSSIWSKSTKSRLLKSVGELLLSSRTCLRLIHLRWKKISTSLWLWLLNLKATIRPPETSIKASPKSLIRSSTRWKAARLSLTYLKKASSKTQTQWKCSEDLYQLRITKDNHWRATPILLTSHIWWKANLRAKKPCIPRMSCPILSQGAMIQLVERLSPKSMLPTSSVSKMRMPSQLRKKVVSKL